MLRSSNSNRLMLFDLSIYGHHPVYIRYLINYWQENQLDIGLDIVVVPKFLQVHQDVVELANKNSDSQLKFVPITSAEVETLKGTKSAVARNIRYFQEWQLLCRYARLLSSSHCLMMYFDTYQLPLLFGDRPPCPVSGIYFKPTFHYSNLTQTNTNWKQNLQQLREKLVLTKLLQNPKLSNLFSLDNYVIKYLEKFPNQDKVISLPDPIAPTEVTQAEVGELRNRWNIPPDKQVFLVFGALTPRKGIDRLLEAIALLAKDLDDKFCLLLIGEASSENKEQFTSKIADLQNQNPQIQIISHFEFVGESEVPIYFQLADLVLAPYQRHIGMSGILLLAAAAGKPVLSSDYGLMGAVVKQYQLGIAVDSSNPSAIAEGLTQFLLHSNQAIGSRSHMQDFVAANSAEHFARVIFNRILPHES
jgi:glycosyltransferase involved in cell wall biosynthesis